MIGNSIVQYLYIFAIDLWVIDLCFNDLIINNS